MKKRNMKRELKETKRQVNNCKGEIRMLREHLSELRFAYSEQSKVIKAITRPPDDSNCKSYWTIK